MSNGTVLWENPNPTAPIAQTDIVLPRQVSGFKYIAIVWLTSTSIAQENTIIFRAEEVAKWGQNNTYGIIGISGGGYEWYVREIVLLSQDTIRIQGTSRLMASGSNNYYIIPVRIIGYN